jgi:hypothetical protein
VEALHSFAVHIGGDVVVHSALPTHQHFHLAALHVHVPRKIPQGWRLLLEQHSTLWKAGLGIARAQMVRVLAMVPC